MDPRANAVEPLRRASQRKNVKLDQTTRRIAGRVVAPGLGEEEVAT